MSLWKHVLICFIPLLALFLAFFAVSFSADSLGLIILSIGFMLNPIVAIPLSFSMTLILDGIQHVIKKMCNSPSSESRFKFTISAYLAIICAVQIYLTKQWDAVRETAIKVSLHRVKSSWNDYMAFPTDQGSQITLIRKTNVDQFWWPTKIYTVILIVMRNALIRGNFRNIW